MAGKRVLVYGGKGALGSVCINHLKSKGFWVASIDLASNDAADANIVVTPSETWTQQHEDVVTRVQETLSDEKVDGIICVAGGWAGGNAAHKDFVKNCDLMWKQSVWTSVIAANLASKLLKEGGMLTLTGAQPALKGTPGMIGYGMAKAAVQHLVSSLAEPNGGLPAESCVAAILPITLDTPMNRKWMSKADMTKWTPLEYVAEMFESWIEGNRPKNGSLVQLVTNDSKTEQIIS